MLTPSDATNRPKSNVSGVQHPHRHSGIRLHTPASVHDGTATSIRQQRAATFDPAYAANPASFGNKRPTPGPHRRLDQRSITRRPHATRTE